MRSDLRRVRRKFSDADVCHFYVVGMCPYEEFERTKHDFGACPLIHDDDLKAQWEVRIPEPCESNKCCVF